MLARPNRAGLIVALDTPDPVTAERWAAALAPHVGAVKLGLEFFVANGPQAVARIARHRPLFLDLKFHDIPNTVAGAVRAALALRPAMLTVHASGGAPMIAAARAAAEEAGPLGPEGRPAILAVTVLTSTDAATLSDTGVAGGPAQQVLRLARLALDAGADGLVCAPPEVALIRAAHGTLGEGGPLLVVPGVRPAGSARGDQSRTATPAETAAAGADWLVIGRPITAASDPAAAAAAIAAELHDRAA